MKMPRFPLLPPGCGELMPDPGGEMSEPVPGSMSMPVMTDVSERPEAVDVRARKRSSRLFCSARRTPWGDSQ